MFVTAQRVLRPGTQLQGINAFYYSHGQVAWDGLPPDGIPDQNPGELIQRVIEVPPPGNRVRSYLDIVAPDETTWNELFQAFVAFVSEAQHSSLPWIGVSGRCMFRVGLELELAGRWQQEVAALWRVAQMLHNQVHGPQS